MTDHEIIRKAIRLREEEIQAYQTLNEAAATVKRANDVLLNMDFTPSVLIIIGAIGGIIVGIIGKLFSFGFWGPLAVGFLFGAFAYWRVVHSAQKDYENDISVNYEQYQAELSAAEQAVQSIENDLSRKEFFCTQIPEKYSDLATLQTLDDYFKNMRASSIKEAINLLESENRMNELLNLQKQQADAVSASTAHLKNIEEQNKKLNKTVRKLRKGQKWTNWWLFWK